MGEGQQSKPKPTKIRVYIYVHKKGSGGYLPGNCQCVACVHVCMHAHTTHVSCPWNTSGDHQAQSATCHWVQFPHGDQLREGLWEEKGRDLEGRGLEPTPARHHPLQLTYVVG